MKRIILLFICILLCASLAGCKLNSGSVDSSLSLVSDQSKTAIEQTSASSAPDTSDAAKETVPPAPKEPTSTSAPPEPETTAPTTETSMSETPTDPYAYPFNIEQIRNDCIALGKSYGFVLNESLTPGNASWAGAETASTNTQGSLLKRMLGEMIEYYSPAYRESIGLPEIHISAFNIYCEQTGNGSYRIYFLFLL